MSAEPSSLRRWLIRDGRPPRSRWTYAAWLFVGAGALVFLKAREAWPACSATIADPNQCVTVRYAVSGPGCVAIDSTLENGSVRRQVLGSLNAARAFAVDRFLGATGLHGHTAVTPFRFTADGTTRRDLDWTASAGADVKLQIGEDGSIERTESAPASDPTHPLLTWQSCCRTPVYFGWDQSRDLDWQPCSGVAPPSNVMLLVGGPFGAGQQGMGVPTGTAVHLIVWIPESVPTWHAEWIADCATPTMVDIAADGSVATRPADSVDRVLKAIALR